MATIPRFTLRLDGDILLAHNSEHQCIYSRRVTQDVCASGTMIVANTKDEDGDWGRYGKKLPSIFTYPNALRVIAALLATGANYDISAHNAEYLTVTFSATCQPAPGLKFDEKLTIMCLKKEESSATLAQLAQLADVFREGAPPEHARADAARCIIQSLSSRIRVDEKLSEISMKFGHIPTVLIPLARAIVASADDGALGMFKIPAINTIGGLKLEVGGKVFEFPRMAEDAGTMARCMLWCAVAAKVNSQQLCGLNIADIPSIGLVIHGKMPYGVKFHPNLLCIALEATDVQKYDAARVWETIQPIHQRPQSLFILPAVLEKVFGAAPGVQFHENGNLLRREPFHAVWRSLSLPDDAVSKEINKMDPRTEYFKQITMQCHEAAMTQSARVFRFDDS